MKYNSQSHPCFSKKLYEASRAKRNSFTSYFGFGKSNRKADRSSVDASGSTSNSTLGDTSAATEKLKRAHEAEEKQRRLVESLTAKVEEFGLKVHCRLRYKYGMHWILIPCYTSSQKQKLSKIASGSNPSWNRLRQSVEDTLFERRTQFKS